MITAKEAYEMAKRKNDDFVNAVRNSNELKNIFEKIETTASKGEYTLHFSLKLKDENDHKKMKIIAETLKEKGFEVKLKPQFEVKLNPQFKDEQLIISWEGIKNA